ncbi:unannotated protein [freshwater metagenome]|uniref:Unannotated protein n=1 Tax=freshwater metagenome TaxID=449393 RepID=A0A6J6U899_9ZZZZ
MSECLVPITRDDHPLACGEAIVLHHMRGSELVECCGDLVQRLAHSRPRRIDAGLVHDQLGKCLTALELGSGRRRAEAGDAVGPHGIGGTRDERHLGADDDEVDPEFGGEIADRLSTRGIDLARLDISRDSGVARCADDAPDSLIQLQRRDESMLPRT